MQFLREYFDPVLDILNYQLFVLGETRITPFGVIYVLCLIVALFYLSNRLKNLLVNKLLTRTRLDTGAQQAIGTITRYLILFVGLLIIFQTVGIDLTALSVLAGAVGIGIGFGLQNVANNFISGLIILIERPIKVGDRIEVDEVDGEVVSIGARSTTIRTNDSIAIIVPNSKFISENVVNWSFGGSMVRFKIPVGVAYDSDIDFVTEQLIQIAEENADVVDNPPPTVRLIELGPSALHFELRAWSRSKLHRPGQFLSNINYEIVRRFREHGIEMPYPQRELHIRSGSSRDFGASESRSAHSS
ncbi:MAG TPA: mechanosensitive ion channel domain-containing protein [Pyrinomonadaceae bacterium]|nr:mechanosensitive ion channel domain-containing protein [Pyrinomonadaceae bacterium]